MLRASTFVVNKYSTSNNRYPTILADVMIIMFEILGVTAIVPDAGSATYILSQYPTIRIFKE